MAALTYRAEILANNKSDRMTAAGSVSPCNPPLVSLCCHRLSEAAESAGLTWLSFGTDGWTVDLVNTLSITQRDTLVLVFFFLFFGAVTSFSPPGMPRYLQKVQLKLRTYCLSLGRR